METDVDGELDVEDVFEKLHEQHGLSFEEFQELVEHKVDSLGGLCDYETAAKLVAHDLGVNPEVEFKDVGDIELQDEYVSFVGKVVQTGDVHEFNRDDGTVGRVANVRLADDTGEVRMALWDELADMVKVGELERGEVLRVDGAKVKEGFDGGVEVSVTGGTSLERDDSEIEIEETFVPIEKLEPGLGAVHVRARVLDASDVRTFQRDDGSEGRVASLRLGDETGKTELTLWGDNTEEVENYEPGDTVEVKYGYTKERKGSTEFHLGRRGSIRESDEEVTYRESFTPLDDVLPDETYDVEARVTAVDDVHTFQRKDGSEGKVANAYLEDESGSIRCAFWDEEAEAIQDASPGDTVVIRDAQGRSGQDGTPELSVSWSSSYELRTGETERYTGPLGEMPSGAQVEVTGRVVTWDGVLDDGTACVETTGKPVPFGRAVRVTGFSEERKGQKGIRVEEGEPVETDPGEEARDLLGRLDDTQ